MVKKPTKIVKLIRNEVLKVCWMDSKGVGGRRVSLDDKDLMIVRMLVENGRAKFREMAEQLGMSDVAVKKRVSRLERSGVIIKYTAIIDPKALGYSVVSFTGVDVEPGELMTVARELASKEWAKGVWITAGDHAVMVEVWARDNAEMEGIIKEISSIPGVKRVCPAVVTETVKPKC